MKRTAILPLSALAIVVFWLAIGGRPQLALAGEDRITASPTETSPDAPAPYMRFRVYGGSVIEDREMPPTLSSGMADYAAIFAKHKICDLLKSGKIDEVWIWAGNGNGQDKPHMLEWTTSGPGWVSVAPDCGEVITTLTYNYTREADVALESFNHRLEGLFMHDVPCDFSTATWPWEGQRVWPVQCAGLLSNRYGFVARPFSENDFVGGCGDAHTPPNILNDEAYNYTLPASAHSICPNWSQDGSAQAATVSCQDWGCTHWGYHVWWMQNLPGLNNTNKDRYGQTHANWWAYMFRSPVIPSTPTATPTVTPLAGASPTPTATVNRTPLSTPTVTRTPTPSPIPVLLYSDGFTNGVGSSWRRQGGAWSPVQGEYRQTDRTAYDTYTWVNGATCRNATVQAKMRLISASPDGDFAYAAGLVVQMQDTDNLYLADLVAVANEARVYKRNQGEWLQLAAVPFNVEMDRSYGLELSVGDGQLSFSVDGRSVLRFQNAQTIGRLAGLRADRALVAFDNFRLYCADPRSATSTPTATSTLTSTPTAMSTATSTVTPTETATATFTVTSTETATATSTVTPTASVTASSSETPTATVTTAPTSTITATAVPTSTVSPAPHATRTPGVVSYLPLVLHTGTAHKSVLAVDAQDRLATLPETLPRQSQFFSKDFPPDVLLKARSQGTQTAVTAPVVYVIYYPGYGTPRANVDGLTNELIDLLEKATIYHGYLSDPPMRGVFLGQDGADYAGIDCSAGTAPDNIHIRVTGMHTNVQPVSYRVEDPVGAGLWTDPCSASWALHVIARNDGTAELYFKPFRDAPDGTIYTVAILYSDDSIQTTAVSGTRVRP